MVLSWTMNIFNRQSIALLSIRRKLQSTECGLKGNQCHEFIRSRGVHTNDTLTYIMEVSVDKCRRSLLLTDVLNEMQQVALN